MRFTRRLCRRVLPNLLVDGRRHCGPLAFNVACEIEIACCRRIVISERQRWRCAENSADHRDRGVCPSCVTIGRASSTRVIFIARHDGKRTCFEAGCAGRYGGGAAVQHVLSTHRWALSALRWQTARRVMTHCGIAGEGC